MRGMSAISGAVLDGEAHLRQSIKDILTTPIGTRVMRRDYGSRLFELIDSAVNQAGRLRVFAAVAEALALWEPRLTLSRVALDAGERSGAFTLTIEGWRNDTPAPETITFSISLSPAALAIS